MFGRYISHMQNCSSVHCEQETPKRVLWQTVKTQMKCRIMWHFIRVCTVCSDKINLQRRNAIFLFWKLQSVTTQYVQLTILTLLYVALLAIPFVQKGFNLYTGNFPITKIQKVFSEEVQLRKFCCSFFFLLVFSWRGDKGSKYHKYHYKRVIIGLPTKRINTTIIGSSFK